MVRRGRGDLPRLFDEGAVGALTDAQLLERFLGPRGDPGAAFEALVARHGSMVARVCRANLRAEHDVEDAFQATFLVLVRRAGSIGERDLLGPWLYGVAHRVARKARAAAARRRDREGGQEADRFDPPDRSTAPGGPASDDAPVLLEEVDRLPSRYRLPVILCHLQGMTHAEAARELSTPVGTVSVRLARARRLLADRLARRGVSAGSGAPLALIGTLAGPLAATPALAPGWASATAAAALVALRGLPLVSAAPAAVLAGALPLARRTTMLMTLSAWKWLALPAAVALTTATGAALVGVGPGAGPPGDGDRPAVVAPAPAPAAPIRVFTVDPALPATPLIPPAPPAGPVTIVRPTALGTDNLNLVITLGPDTPKPVQDGATGWVEAQDLAAQGNLRDLASLVASLRRSDPAATVRLIARGVILFRQDLGSAAKPDQRTYKANALDFRATAGQLPEIVAGLAETNPAATFELRMTGGTIRYEGDPPRLLELPAAPAPTPPRAADAVGVFIAAPAAGHWGQQIEYQVSVETRPRAGSSRDITVTVKLPTQGGKMVGPAPEGMTFDARNRQLVWKIPGFAERHTETKTIRYLLNQPGTYRCVAELTAGSIQLATEARTEVTPPSVPVEDPGAEVAPPTPKMAGADGASPPAEPEDGRPVLAPRDGAAPDEPGPVERPRVEPPLVVSADNEVELPEPPPAGYFDLAAPDPNQPNSPRPVRVGQTIAVEVLEALPGRPITGTRVVRADGTISLGFHGDLAVAGLNRDQIKVKLIERLRTHLKDAPLGLIQAHRDGTHFAVPPLRSDRVFVDDQPDPLVPVLPIRPNPAPAAPDAAEILRTADDLAGKLDAALGAIEQLRRERAGTRPDPAAPAAADPPRTP